jgi:hypothetical protein
LEGHKGARRGSCGVCGSTLAALPSTSCSAGARRSACEGSSSSLAHQGKLLFERPVLYCEAVDEGGELDVLRLQLAAPPLQVRHLRLLALAREVRVLAVALHARLQGGWVGTKSSERTSRRHG